MVIKREKKDKFKNFVHTKNMKNALVGIIVGIISGMFSAGGGLLLVPIFAYMFKLSEKEARATSLFCILPMVIITAIVYSKNNFIDWQIGIKCAIGGIIGGIIGSKLLNKMQTKHLRILFILFLFYAGIKLAV